MNNSPTAITDSTTDQQTEPTHQKCYGQRKPMNEFTSTLPYKFTLNNNNNYIILFEDCIYNCDIRLTPRVIKAVDLIAPTEKRYWYCNIPKCNRRLLSEGFNIIKQSFQHNHDIDPTTFIKQKFHWDLKFNATKSKLSPKEIIEQTIQEKEEYKTIDINSLNIQEKLILTWKNIGKPDKKKQGIITRNNIKSVMKPYKPTTPHRFSLSNSDICILILKNYKFICQTRVKLLDGAIDFIEEGEHRKWRCSLKTCNKRLQTFGKKITYESGEHDHFPNSFGSGKDEEKKINKREFYKLLKVNAKANMEATPGKIIEDTVNLHTKFSSLILIRENLVRLISKARGGK